MIAPAKTAKTPKIPTRVAMTSRITPAATTEPDVAGAAADVATCADHAAVGSPASSGGSSVMPQAYADSAAVRYAHLPMPWTHPAKIAFIGSHSVRKTNAVHAFASTVG